MRLFCIPGGAASAISYLRWSRHLSREYKLCLLEIPGRGLRAKENPVYDIEVLAEILYEDLCKQLGDETDYMLLGYSFGAIVGYELYRKIEEKSFCKPLRIFFSASDAPDGTTYTTPLFSDRSMKKEAQEVLSRYFPDHLFPDKQLVEQFCEKFTEILYVKYARYGRLIPVKPEEILENDDFSLRKALEFANSTMELFDVDQKIVFDYQKSEKEHIKIDSNITIFAGSEDTMTAQSTVERWRKFAMRDFDIEIIQGGHLILIDNIKDSVERINEIIRKDMRKL